MGLYMLANRNQGRLLQSVPRSQPAGKAGRSQAWKVPLACLLCLLLLAGTGVSHAGAPNADAVAAMRAKYVSLEHALRQNQFRRPLVLDSVETPNSLQG